MKNFKKFISLVLSCAIILSLCITAFAAETGSTTVEYYTDADGNTYETTRTIEPNGRVRAVVVGPTGRSEAIKDEHSITITTTTLDGTVHQVTNSLDTTYATENAEMLSTRAVSEISGEAWGFNCRMNDQRESTVGILWSLAAEDTTYGTGTNTRVTYHSAYDGNDSTARGYAESFWSQIISMNASIRDAQIAMAEYTIQVYNTVVSAMAGVLGTLEAVQSVLSASLCNYASAQHWKTAREYANMANYNFNRYRSATQSSTQSMTALFY